MSVDLLANIASKLIPSEDYNPKKFFIELIFRPSIPDNFTNWWIFSHDEDILRFLAYEGSHDDKIIDENEHDNQLKQKSNQNPIPKFVVKLEEIYDLKTDLRRLLILNSKVQP